MEQEVTSSPGVPPPPLLLPSEFCLTAVRVVTWPLKHTSAACAQQKAVYGLMRVSLSPVAAIFIKNAAVKCVLEHSDWLRGVATRPAMQINVILANDLPNTPIQGFSFWAWR